MRRARIVNGRGMVPVGKLARECPKCGAKPGHRCGRMVSQSWVPNNANHRERSAGHKGGEVTGYGNWPPLYDSIKRRRGEPKGWHVRELTGDGHPIMGTSPAERDAAAWRGIRLWAAGLIWTHPFEGDGRYCQVWSGAGTMAYPAVGEISIRVQCGMPRESHPLADDLDEVPEGWAEP